MFSAQLPAKYVEQNCIEEKKRPKIERKNKKTKKKKQKESKWANEEIMGKITTQNIN